MPRPSDGGCGSLLGATWAAIFAVYAGYLAVHIFTAVGRWGSDRSAAWEQVQVATGVVHLALAEVSKRAAGLQARGKRSGAAPASWLVVQLASGHVPPQDSGLGALLAGVDSAYALALAAAVGRFAALGDVDLGYGRFFWPVWSLGVAACVLCFAKTATKL
jgi:hypothetical protein